MKCDSWASLLARTFASLYLRREPNNRVATHNIDRIDINLNQHDNQPLLMNNFKKI
jgi:hypothetical protein